jgi:lysozyme
MRQINSAGLALIKEFEGLRLDSYICAGGVETVGWGHTGPDVKHPMKITLQQAEGFLKADLAKFEAGVERLIGDADVNDNMYSACVSLAYNIGLAAFERSTVLKRIRLGNKMGAANAFLMWNRAGGRVLPGLMRRREAERKLFLS